MQSDSEALTLELDVKVELKDYLRLVYRNVFQTSRDVKLLLVSCPGNNFTKSAHLLEN